MAMSPSSTVHRGQHDTKCVTFELLMHAAIVADEIWGFTPEPARTAYSACGSTAPFPPLPSTPDFSISSVKKAFRINSSIYFRVIQVRDSSVFFAMEYEADRFCAMCTLTSSSSFLPRNMVNVFSALSMRTRYSAVLFILFHPDSLELSRYSRLFRRRFERVQILQQHVRCNARRISLHHSYQNEGVASIQSIRQSVI